MNSNILKSIGLKDLDPAVYIIALLVICIALLIYNISTSKKLKKLSAKYDEFMSGKDAKTMEEVIYKRFDEIDRLVVADRVKSDDIQHIQENLRITFQKMGIVKYDAFNEMGGKLSFALCLLDINNNGFLMNSMHSREGCYTYIKEIIDGTSAIELGAEEEKALNIALGEAK